jgi:hypothetical protein
MRTVPLRPLLLLALAACGRVPAPSPRAGPGVGLPGDLVGCYELELTRPLYYVPVRLRLNADTIPAEVRLFARDTLPAWTLTRLDAEGRPLHERLPYAGLFWRPHSGPDSVLIVIHTGYGGASLNVHAPARADTLRGRATAHRDVGPPYSTDGGRVALVRVPCAGAPDAV